MAPSKQIKFKKGAKKSNNGTNKFVTKAFVKPPFPFEEYKNPELGRSNSVEFECKVDPTKTDSRTINQQVIFKPITSETNKSKHILKNPT